MTPSGTEPTISSSRPHLEEATFMKTGYQTLIQPTGHALEYCDTNPPSPITQGEWSCYFLSNDPISRIHLSTAQHCNMSQPMFGNQRKASRFQVRQGCPNASFAGQPQIGKAYVYTTQAFVCINQQAKRRG
jgi:hypothetical protein